MSKFNETKTTPMVINDADGKAYAGTNLFQRGIAAIAVNSMLNGDSYYQAESDRVKEVYSLVEKHASNEADMLFLAQTIVWARTKANLRSISHVLSTALLENVKGHSFVRKALFRSMIRPDDAAEILSIHNARHGKNKIPNAFLKALKDSLEIKWDLYVFRKYQLLNNSVSLRDLVNVAHPRPSKWLKGEEDAFSMILNGTLPAIQTAQTVNAGTSDQDARHEVYYEMLENKKLGYMAMLKSITKMIPKTKAEYKLLKDLIRNENAIQGSRVLPKRFVQAYLMLKDAGDTSEYAVKLYKHLEKAFISSTKNVELIKKGERVAILLDTSGSMGSLDMSLSRPISNGKILTAMTIAAVGEENVSVYAWSTTAKKMDHFGLSPFKFIEAKLPNVGHSTYLHLAFEQLTESGVVYDKIIVLTDTQTYGGSAQDAFKKYKKATGANPHVVIWDLDGRYGQGTPLKLNDKVIEVSGYSDKILDIVAKSVEDKDAMINEIKSVEL